MNGKSIKEDYCEQYNRMLFEKSVLGLALCKMNGELVDVNPAYAEIIGKTVEETLNLTYWEITPESYSEQEKIQLENLNKTGKYGPYEKEYIHNNGHLVPVSLSGQIIEKDGEKYILSSVENISERKKAEKQIARLQKELEQLSFQDGLTGIANRRMFDMVLEREWARAQREQLPLSLIITDIDYFKQYNDHYGHLEGDACLIRVADALNNVSRRSMDLVARYGGEEIVLLLPETTKDQAIQLAQQCCNTVYKLQIPHESSLTEKIITLSVGVDTVIPTIESLDVSIIESTDKLLYRAKENGRNIIEYS